MRPFLVFCVMAVFAMLPLPAGAAGDNAIKIVNEDGSVTVFEIPKEAVKAAPPPEKGGWGLRRRPEERRREETAAPAPEAVEYEELAVPAEEPPEEYVPPQKPVETIDWRGEPVGKAAAPAENARPAEIVKLIPVPGRKPLRTPASMARVDEVPDSFPLPQGGVIPQNRAVAIAIDRAPPARDFDVFRRMHGDRRVYAVVFRTDSGPYEVLVDAQSGDVVGQPPRRRN